MTTVWINTDDRNWSREGAIFDDYAKAKRGAAANAAVFDTDDLLATLEQIVIENATASEIEDIEREIAMLGELAPSTMQAIADRKRITHPDD
jgi:hypothetical protein